MLVNALVSKRNSPLLMKSPSLPQHSCRTLSFNVLSFFMYSSFCPSDLSCHRNGRGTTS
uniref:Uncharacterized protein n=1 Tax=Utricularia reniformis TaxID=192314 RepID=A0A1Y0B3F7_9LAMI|nr:hypothetical protein AEK19_MT1736 [Utricularia reniformis]ART31913.1 hypothetical protein AEK19_MT1736 [Utricularia reniformis]